MERVKKGGLYPQNLHLFIKPKKYLWLVFSFFIAIGILWGFHSNESKYVFAASCCPPPGGCDSGPSSSNGTVQVRNASGGSDNILYACKDDDEAVIRFGAVNGFLCWSSGSWYGGWYDSKDSLVFGGYGKVWPQWVKDAFGSSPCPHTPCAFWKIHGVTRTIGTYQVGGAIAGDSSCNAGSYWRCGSIANVEIRDGGYCSRPCGDCIPAGCACNASTGECGYNPDGDNVFASASPEKAFAKEEDRENINMEMDGLAINKTTVFENRFLWASIFDNAEEFVQAIFYFFTELINNKIISK